MALTVTTPPATEPVTTAEAKSHCRVDIATDDTLIDGLIEAAREYAEVITRRAFITQTLLLTLDSFPTEILLPRPPAITIGATDLKYTDIDGAEQSLAAANYTIDNKTEPARVVLSATGSWPSTQSVVNAVRITYTAGYGAAAAVPQAIKQAILLLVGHWYENRESTVSGTIIKSIPDGVDALLWAYRVIDYRLGEQGA